MLFVLLIVFASFLFFYSELKEVSRVLIGSYGLFGLFVLVIIMDTVIQPISPDILVFSATFAGSNLFAASLVGGIASCVAGVLGYSIGQIIGKEGFKKWFSAKHLKEGKILFDKYGIWAVLVGALSPIPYSSICWSAGIYHMDITKFILTSLLTRIPRFFLMGLLGFAI